MHSSLIDLGSFGMATLVRNWMRSLRYECAFYERGTDPASPDFAGPLIYIFWHEYIPFMFYLRGHCDIAMLTSQHRDAEMLSRAAQIMGFSLVRGSSRRGGVGALREMIRQGDGKSLTLTPDGPRGPRRTLAPGCLFMSAKLGIPLVPVGLGYDNPWRSRRSWDQFAIPRPWSRAVAVIGPRIQVPSDLERQDVEDWRVHVQSALNQVTELAERSAETGRAVANSRAVTRASRSLVCFRSASPALAPLAPSSAWRASHAATRSSFRSRPAA